MLKQQQEEEVEGYVSPIANLRVTPQELAQAVAAIEAKRDIGVTGDTIAIGDAISQLGLSVTPQEVYSEIRSMQSRPVSSVDSVSAVSQQANVKNEQRGRGRRSVWRFVFVVSILMNFAMLRKSEVMVTHSYEAPITASIAGGSTISVSSITAEQSGYATLDQIYELANGKNPEKVLVSSMEGEENRFQLIRLNDQLFVRGYRILQESFVTNGMMYTQNHLFARSWGTDMVPKSVALSAFKNHRDPDVMFNNYPGVLIQDSKEPK